MSDAAEKLLEKAELLTEVERWNDALPLLFRALAQDPVHFQTNCLLALCFYSLRDFEKALPFAEQAVAAAPDEEWGHRLRSVVLTELGRKKQALQAAAEAVRLAPYEPFALQVLTNAYLSVDNPRQAEECAEQMRELAPESENSYFTLGNVYLHSGRNYEAEKAFREALRLNPNFADARNNLGVALLRQKENPGSFNRPSSISILQTEDADEIQRHFTEAVRLEPGNEVAAENLRSQFDYFIGIYGFLVFVPFYLICFFVAPGMAIVTFLFSAYSFFKTLWEIRQRRRSLSPEMRLFLNSTQKKLSGRLRDLSAINRRIIRKTWKPHLLALLAVVLRHSHLVLPKAVQSEWTTPLAYIMIIASFVWLVSELGKDE